MNNAKNLMKSVTVATAFKNFEATDAIKDTAEQKIVACLSKYVHHDTEAHLVLKIEKNRKIAELTFHTDGADFQAKEESADMYSSIDSLVHNISRQLIKHKEKMTAHHQ